MGLYEERGTLQSSLRKEVSLTICLGRAYEATYIIILGIF